MLSPPCRSVGIGDGLRVSAGDPRAVSSARSRAMLRTGRFQTCDDGSEGWDGGPSHGSDPSARQPGDTGDRGVADHGRRVRSFPRAAWRADRRPADPGHPGPGSAARRSASVRGGAGDPLPGQRPGRSGCPTDAEQPGDHRDESGQAGSRLGPSPVRHGGVFQVRGLERSAGDRRAIRGADRARDAGGRFGRGELRARTTWPRIAEASADDEAAPRTTSSSTRRLTSPGTRQS